MEQSETKKVRNGSYICTYCEYSTSRPSQYERHLDTNKHTMFLNETKLKHKGTTPYHCICSKMFCSRTTLWRHKKKCNYKEETTDTNSDKELVLMLIKQNSDLLEVLKQGTHNTINNTISHNKTFNLNVFLNETCKDAMNINEFVDSIKLQLSDLENVGKTGYVEGISSIIVKNLKALDENKRPIHCADKKRETMYIKDENTWEKDDEEKKLRKAIKNVAFKNQRLILKFKEVHPDCGKSTSACSDQYNRILVECMGGSGDNDIEKEDKIIRKISNVTTIDKN
jgi:hypothetical protein